MPKLTMMGALKNCSFSLTPILLLFVLMLLSPGAAVAKDAAGTWKQKEIWITFWSAPPATDALLKQVSSENFNVTWGDEAALEVARKNRLKLILQHPLLKPETLDDPTRRQQLDQLVERVKAHPAMEAYFLADEPLTKDFAGLGKLVAYLKQRDPQHVAYINLLPSYAGDKLRIAWLQRALKIAGESDPYTTYVRDFVAAVKPSILSYDHYHFYRGSDPDEFFSTWK